MVDGNQLLDVVLGKILDHEIERPQDRHAPLGRLVEPVADRVIEHGEIDTLLALDMPMRRTKRGSPPAARRGGAGRQGRHARIVPAAHDAAPYQIRQVSAWKGRCIPG